MDVRTVYLHRLLATLGYRHAAWSSMATNPSRSRQNFLVSEQHLAQVLIGRSSTGIPRAGGLGEGRTGWPAHNPGAEVMLPRQNGVGRRRELSPPPSRLGPHTRDAQRSAGQRGAPCHPPYAIYMYTVSRAHAQRWRGSHLREELEGEASSSSMLASLISPIRLNRSAAITTVACQPHPVPHRYSSATRAVPCDALRGRLVPPGWPANAPRA